MSIKKNILLGYSGHAYVVAEAAFKAGMAIQYYADKEEAQNNPFNLKFLGNEGSNGFEGWNKGFGFILGIGNNDIRTELGELVTVREEELLTVIHPSAEISKSADVGKGTFVSSQASVNALSIIGEFVILNTNCVIEHECQIADGAHIAPGAVLAGNVKVGKSSFIGANAVVKEGVNIGANVIIGAGATIIDDVPHNKKIVGNPGREI